jgi:hypothetical protein
MRPAIVTTDGWFRVWIRWSHCSEFLVDVQATCADSALHAAVWRGLVSGLGYNPAYQGLHAVQMDGPPVSVVERELPITIRDRFPADIFAANGRN